MGGAGGLLAATFGHAATAFRRARHGSFACGHVTSALVFGQDGLLDVQVGLHIGIMAAHFLGVIAGFAFALAFALFFMI